MTIIEQLGELDPATKHHVTTWWREDDERIHGADVISKAEESGAYRSDITLVHRLDGKVVGVATGKCSLGLGYLFELIVKEGNRNQGIGSTLLAAFEQACREHACFHLALRTQSLEAVSFYENHGWLVEFISPDWFGGQATHQMRKTL